MSANLGVASRFYREKVITPTAGGGQVRLKHRELFLTESMQKATEQTVTDARFKVLTARARMAISPLPAEVDAALTQYFKTTGTSAIDCNVILSTLQLISNGINADVNIKVSYVNKVHLPDGLAQTDVEGYVRGKNAGDIHVSPEYIKGNAFQAVRTFIHEASHKYASTDDFGEQGYIFADGSDFRRAGITKADCLKNADSYAYFVMKVAP
jgi:hypothetical protein